MAITLRDQALPFVAITLACLCVLSFYSITRSVTWIFVLFTIIGIVLIKVVKPQEPLPIWRQFLPIFTIVFGFLFVLSMVSVLIYQVDQ
jgi:hypothetical protein